MERFIDHVYLGFNTLNRALIKNVSVRFVGLGYSFRQSIMSPCFSVLSFLFTHDESVDRRSSLSRSTGHTGKLK
tara:strand:- start:8993 stop:9214 length:222 start_codon:yes stop_codon:yes gene_type:complete